MKSAIEHTFTGPTTPYASYDSTKTTLGTLIQQRTGPTADDRFAGPIPMGMARPMEQSTAIPAGLLSAISWSSDVDWVFYADNAAIALTRRIGLYEYTRSTSTYEWKGSITLGFSAITGNKTIRGFKAVRTVHTTGTVEVSGTAVTGTSTQFVAERIAAGCRIGFGSTDPTAIVTWYHIGSIGSDTSITLTSPAGTIAGGTAYVIEEVRLVLSILNATATNGGLFLVKGLSFNTFSPSPTTILEASTVDNTQSIYWLADAASVTDVAPGGLALDTTSSHTSHFVWTINGTTTAQFFKYDIRAQLTSIVTAKTTAAFLFKTGISATLSGTAGVTGNLQLATATHSPVSGTKALYFCTTNRLYKCDESAITSAATLFLSDLMSENPVGGTNTYAAMSVMSQPEYDSVTDRFIITSVAERAYMTAFYSTPTQMDAIFLGQSRQIDQSSAGEGTVPNPSHQSITYVGSCVGGIWHMCRSNALGTAGVAGNNQIYAIPVGADWLYASSTNQRLITPSLSTANASRFYNAYVNADRVIGGAVLGSVPEGYRLYYRTSGITDNTGSWTLLNDAGDMSGVTPGASIQFMLEFRILGLMCIPARIHGIAVTYEDNSTDSHYQPSVTLSSATNRIFAWRQSVAWGGSIPNLRIRLYNAASDALILDDTVTGSASGVWQYSTDGNNWLTWSSGADLVGNYIRYTANSLPGGVSIKGVLTQ